MSPLKSPLTLCLALITLSIGVSADPPRKIIGGVKATLVEFLYIASLRSMATNKHFCAASIVTRNHLVTAAHCVRRKYTNSMYAVIGTIHRDNSDREYLIRKIKIHRAYSADPYYLADIAIVTLSNPLSRQQSWATIPIATRNYGAGSIATIAGWGTTEDETEPNVLHFIQEPLANMSTCARHMDERSASLKLCILEVNGKSTCPGDSGGPVVVNNELVGIVSTGLCRDANSFFTKVYEFRNFISANIRRYRNRREKRDKDRNIRKRKRFSN